MDLTLSSWGLFFGEKTLKLSLGRLGRVEGRFVAPKSSPRALWRAFGAEVARRRRPGRFRRVPGSISGGLPKRHILDFFSRLRGLLFFACF